MSDARAAWDAWYATLDEVRAAIEATDRFRDHPQLRPAAYQSLLEAQAMAYNFAVAPRRQMSHPRLYPHGTWHDTTLALGQPIQDFAYTGLFLDGARTYRARGRLGDVRLWLTQVHDHILGDPRSREIGNYDYHDFDLGPGGKFEIVLSAKPHEGNWIALDADSPYNCLFMRRIVGDWNDDLGEMTIEAEPGGEVIDRDPVRAGVEGIQAAAHLLRYLVTAFTIGLHDLYIARAGGVNAWATMPGAEVKDSLIGSRSTDYVPGVYSIASDEALVIEWDPPASAYWSFQVGDVWSRPLDSMHRQSDLNMVRAVPDPDGRVRVVIALEDPGVPNWLDPAGNTTGTMVVRNYRSPTPTPPPPLRRVKAADLRSVLPADTVTITPAERAAALAYRTRSMSAFVRH